jgi:hypothetical protein
MEQTENKNELVKRVLLQPGHKCFEYNITENELSYAKYSEGKVKIDDTSVVMKKVDMNKECVYVTALNFKNATKHLRKMFKVDFIPVIVK